MGFVTKLGRVIVTLLNIIFIIISLCLITAGVIALKASEIDFIKTVEESIKTALETLNTNMQTGTDNSSIENFSISELLGGIALACIIAGSILLCLSFFGCCGACCKFRTLIFLYGLIVTVLLLAEIIVVILMYAAPDTIEGKIKDGLLESLKNYKGIGSADVTTLGWMFVMQQMKCCGVNGYTDFENTATNDWKSPATGVSGLDAPLVCCVVEPTAANTTCARSSTLNVYEKGCFDAVWDTVLGNPKWAGIGYGAAFTFQLLLIIFSVLMYMDKKKKGNKIYPNA